MRPVRVAAMLAVLVVLMACFVGRPGDDGTTPAPRVTPGADASEFERDVAGAVAGAEDYWRGIFERSGGSFQPIRRVIAYQRDGEVSCGDQEIPRNNAAYCSGEDFIAYDVNWAATVFDRIGDAFVFFMLGHEYAHGIQVRFGLRYEFTIQQELQADCMAGAYMGDSIRSGRFELESGDIEELRLGLAAIGDDPNQPWFAPGSHGNPQQRTNSFFAGYQSSLSACNIG